MLLTEETRNQTDSYSRILADYVAQSIDADLENCRRPASRIVLDSLAVAMGALNHPASIAARRYADLLGAEGPCSLWGTTQTANVETATLVNGVLLRCYDYNDLYIGTASGGHPSDSIAGLIGIAESRDLSGDDLFRGVAVTYDITLTLFDLVPIAKFGWDYANLTQIGATCGIASMLGFSHAQTCEALAITVTPHVSLNEVESGDLNVRGDLTMWKRFNGADAIRHSVYACLLTEAGAEGVPRPFLGRIGFFAQLFNQTEQAAAAESLARSLTTSQIGHRLIDTTMKRWPVGSRAQSAIQAALEARSQIPTTEPITKVVVHTGSDVYRHLVTARQDPWNPISRETADHSLPFIVGSALLDGNISTETFKPANITDPRRRAFVNEAVSIEVSDDLDTGFAGGFASSVKIYLRDGTTVTGTARPFPGHPDNPFSDSDVEQKFRENAHHLKSSQIDAAMAWINSISASPPVRDLTASVTGSPA